MKLFIAILLLTIPLVVHAQDVDSKIESTELQSALRRYMQCQADNVGNYNIQSRLFLEQQQQLIAELKRIKLELTQALAKKEHSNGD